MIRRRTALTLPAALGTSLALAPWLARPSRRSDTFVLAMTLGPPGLDPTAGPPPAIGERSRSTTSSEGVDQGQQRLDDLALAQSWTVTPDNKTWAGSSPV